MRAIVQDRYGPAEVLELREVARPTVGSGEVLVRVHAAGVDRGVWHLMTGLPYPVRLAYGPRRPRTPTPGMDLAGVVVDVGSDVTRFRPGDEVFGIGVGTFADYARAPEAKLVAKPAGLTFEQAAVVAISGATALQAVRDHGRVRPGQQVLVIGASGGVGSYAVQIAKAYGAEVTGVASSTKLDLVRSLGADHVVDYTREDFADGTQRYDVIIDIGGNAGLSRLRGALTPTGTAVITGGETDGRWLGGYDRQLRASMLSPFVGQRLTTFVNKEALADLEALVELLEAGTVVPAVDRAFPLADAAKAVRYVEEGHARGKVVVTVA
jgi:NADPH:quinone reductase-like Zn-dependent oxidoreductase